MAVIVVAVLLFGAVALSGWGQGGSAQSTVSAFFSDYSDQDFDAAMQHTIVAKMNTSAQETYVVYLEAQATDASIDINHMTDVTDNLGDTVTNAINSGMATLGMEMGVTIDDWTALFVNMTETYASSNYQATSDFYLLVLHCNGGWYVEPASFQENADDWAKVYA
jgi:hypothetical protein